MKNNVSVNFSSEKSTQKTSQKEGKTITSSPIWVISFKTGICNSFTEKGTFLSLKHMGPFVNHVPS